MLMVMMTTTPQAENSETQAEEMTDMQECGEAIKAILTAMSATDLFRACGLQGREQGEGLAKARHALARLVEKESATAHPDEGNLSDHNDYLSCSSSFGR